jgi:hypothetical protein
MDDDTREEISADEFMVITLITEFRGKLHPKFKAEEEKAGEVPQLDHIKACHYTLPAGEDGAVYLEKIVKAIREKRLYGFMIQDSADSHCSAKEWVELTNDDVFADGGMPPYVLGFTARKNTARKNRQK